MKIGDLVIHRNAPPGEGRIRLVVKFGKKLYTYVDNTRPHMKSTVYFADGLWDWNVLTNYNLISWFRIPIDIDQSLRELIQSKITEEQLKSWKSDTFVPANI